MSGFEKGDLIALVFFSYMYSAEGYSLASNEFCIKFRAALTPKIFVITSSSV